MDRDEKMVTEETGMQPEAQFSAGNESGKKKKEKVKKSLGREILEWVITILVAVVAALAIRSFIFEPIRVDGASMNDTLKDGDIMFVSKWDYNSVWLSMPWQTDAEKETAARIESGFSDPKRFDVVVCRYPGRGDTNFVKRIVGMPGDTVSLQDGYLYVNGEKYDEPYINDSYRVSGGSNGWAFDEVSIPAKGAKVSLEYANEAKTYVVLKVDGKTWPWRALSSAAVSENGDRFVYNNGMYLNGKDISGDTDAIISLIGREFTLEQDCYFVMGDHRNNSNDSRAQGPITRDMIVGHVRFVFWPFNAFRGIQ